MGLNLVDKLGFMATWRGFTGVLLLALALLFVLERMVRRRRRSGLDVPACRSNSNAAVISRSVRPRGEAPPGEGDRTRSLDDAPG